MAQTWRNPYNSYIPWSQCTTCGQDWPSQKVIYNPRFGWQCPPCWDGLVQRDQIDPPVFSYEGTRKTPSPLTNTLLEGIAPGNLLQNYTYVFVDRDGSGTLWSVNFNASPLPTLTQTTTIPVSQAAAYDFMVTLNLARIYVQNGQLAATFTNAASCPTPQGNSGIFCGLGQASIFVRPGEGVPPGSPVIIYTPPGGSETPVNPGSENTFCTVTTTVVHETFQSNLCETPNLVVEEFFESELCDTPNHIVAEFFES